MFLYARSSQSVVCDSPFPAFGCPKEQAFIFISED